MTLLVVLTLGLLTIAAANAVSPRLRVPPALLLVAVGVLAGLSGLVPSLALDPEVELAVLLPALLYAAAASMPATVFRREFTTVKSLSLVLVVVTALVLGLLFWWLIPGLGFGWGVALGAALAPTDSVTPGIARAAGLRGRVLSVVGFVTLLFVRINFMQPVLRSMDRRLHRDVQRRVRVETRRQSLPGDKVHPRWESRLRRWFADIAYQSAEPLGRNSGFLIAWAGVRGALSLAAVHTLPETMPHRGMATLVAFTIVLLSLLVQGLTLPLAARRLAAPRDLEAQQQQAQRLVAYLEEAASEPAAAHPGQATARTDPRYAALARARDEGGFDIEVLDAALRRLDAGELAEAAGH